MIVMAVMREYYSTWFAADLADFLGSRPHPYFGHAWNSNCAGMLARVDDQRQPFFLICLYFTVLLDQAMYTYYRPSYSRFASLTGNPKFCHGLSQFQLNPREIMLTPVDQGIVSDEHMRTLLPAAMKLFVEEVTSFCRDHMQHIDPAPVV